MIDNRYLLLDTALWAQANHLTVTPGQARKAGQNPLFGEDLPWEVRHDNLYPNVIFDPTDNLYKCWYNPFIIDVATSDTPPAQRERGAYRAALDRARAAEHVRKHREMGVCYAVSTDGIRWDRPELDLIEFNGSTRNNLVMRDVHGVGVTLDPHDPDPAGRFKAFMEGGTASSPDGLHWSPIRPCPEIDARWDTHNNLFWDERHAGMSA